MSGRPSSRADAQREIVLGCATLAIAGGYYAMTARIQQSDIADVIGPRGLPNTYAAVLAGLSIILIVRSVARRGTASPAATAQPAPPAPAAAGVARGGVAWRTFGMLMNGVIYILIVPWLGYIVSIAALISATVYYQGGGLNRRVAAVAICGALLLWLLFVRLLHIAHPAGIWPSLL